MVVMYIIIIKSSSHSCCVFYITVQLCSWQEMLGMQLANGVIQPLTNFLLNDLTRVQQRKTTFEEVAKGVVTFSSSTELHVMCM